jgi:hypothetical protein
MSLPARDNLRRERQRREQRLSEAVQSPKWGTKLVASHNLKWLQAKGLIAESADLKDAVGTVLHRMVLDGQFVTTLCRILDLWKAFADNNGMRISEFHALQEEQEAFAYASLVLGLIRNSTTEHEGGLAVDLQDCLRMWRTVRLG